MRTSIILLFFLFGLNNVYGQKNDSLYFPKVRLGFLFALNYSDLKLFNNHDNSSIKNDFGFQNGVFMERKITKNIFLSPELSLLFNNSIKIGNSSLNEKTIHVNESGIYFLMPILFRFENNKLNPYLKTGPQFRFIIYNDTAVSDMKIKKIDILYDIGFGLDINTIFTIAPEFRYSFGLINMSKDSEYKSVYINYFSLLLNFK